MENQFHFIGFSRESDKVYIKEEKLHFSQKNQNSYKIL